MTTFVSSRDGTRLALYRWSPRATPAATVVLVHGGAEHLGRYEELATTLTDAGFAVLGVDLRGHGHSEGARGYLRAMESYLEDVDAAVAVVETEPRFLLGHSMGGLIAIRWVIDTHRRCDGLVLSSPFFGFTPTIPRVKLVAARLLARVVPRLSMTGGIKGVDVSRDPETQRAYDTDPLINRTANVQWLRAIEAGQAEVDARAAEIRVPLLCMYAGADRLVDAARTASVMARVSSPDKAVERLEGHAHELFNEPPEDRKRIFGRTVGWLVEHHLARRSA